MSQTVVADVLTGGGRSPQPQSLARAHGLRDLRHFKGNVQKLRRPMPRQNAADRLILAVFQPKILIARADGDFPAFWGRARRPCCAKLIARGLARGERSVVIENKFGPWPATPDVLSPQRAFRFSNWTGGCVLSLKNDSPQRSSASGRVATGPAVFEPWGSHSRQLAGDGARAAHRSALPSARFSRSWNTLAWSTAGERYGSFFARRWRLPTSSR